MKKPEVIERYEGLLGPMVKVAQPCVMCLTTTVMDLPADRFDEWVGGELVQVAFPEMTHEDRDVLAIGVCPPCNVILWAEPEEEDCG